MRSDENEQMKALLARYELPLLLFATRITGDRERARDVVQETFVKYRHNGSLANEKPPATWLFTVCRNGALNVCRKEKRMTFLDEGMIETRADEQALPFEQMERREAAGFLLKIVATVAAAAAGSDSAEVSKRSQLSTDC